MALFVYLMYLVSFRDILLANVTMNLFYVHNKRIDQTELILC